MPGATDDVAATITVIYSVCVFGSVKRVKRGVGRGFIAIDVLGNIFAIVLAVSALALGISGALAFNGVDGIGYVYMAAICAGAFMLILSSFFLIAGNVKRKREEQERQRRLIERERADRMRARRAYGYR